MEPPTDPARFIDQLELKHVHRFVERRSALSRCAGWLAQCLSRACRQLSVAFETSDGQSARLCKDEGAFDGVAKPARMARPKI